MEVVINIKKTFTIFILGLLLMVGVASAAPFNLPVSWILQNNGTTIDADGNGWPDYADNVLNASYAGTADNTENLNGQPANYYLNYDNMNNGSVSDTYIDSSSYWNNKAATGACAPGYHVSNISNSTVTCTVDQDTTYTAGANLELSGTTFSVDVETLGVALENSVLLSYRNITNIPTCSGDDKLTYNGTHLTCEDDDTGSNTQLSQEQVQDFAWNVLGGNQSGITVTYNDTANTVDFIVTEVATGAVNMSDLGDVSLNSLANGEALVYNATSGLWENQGVSVDLSNYYTKAEVNNLNVSTFTNDAGYITSYTDTKWLIDNDYLINQSGTLTVNETKLNSTIDGRETETYLKRDGKKLSLLYDGGVSYGDELVTEVATRDDSVGFENFTLIDNTSFEGYNTGTGGSDYGGAGTNSFPVVNGEQYKFTLDYTVLNGTTTTMVKLDQNILAATKSNQVELTGEGRQEGVLIATETGDFKFNLYTGRSDEVTVRVENVSVKRMVTDDLTANGNDGTLRNGVSIVNGSMVFDGVDDYIRLDETLDIGTEHTIFLRGSMDDLSTSGVLGTGTLYYAFKGNRFSFYFGGGRRDIPISFDTGVVYDFAIVRDNLNVKLYADGVLIGEHNETVNNPLNAMVLMATSNSLFFYDGTVEQYAIFNKTLSEQEVQSLDINTYVDDYNDMLNNYSYYIFGDVGVGTSNPTSKLDVDGNVTADYFIGDGSQLTNVGGTETDPVWTSDKTNYYNKTETDNKYYLASNPLGYISDYTVTSSDVTQHQADINITESQITDLQTYYLASNPDGYISDYTETDPVWTSDKTDYYTSTQVDALPVSTFSNDAGYLTSYTETDPVWTNDKTSYNTTAELDTRYPQIDTANDGRLLESCDYTGTCINETGLQTSIVKTITYGTIGQYAKSNGLNGLVYTDTIPASNITGLDYFTNADETDPVWTSDKINYYNTTQVYNKTEADNNFVDVSGDTMSGNLSMGTNCITFNSGGSICSAS